VRVKWGDRQVTVATLRTVAGDAEQLQQQLQQQQAPRR
jgi:hypothetical protein